jgi:hypothetical protein
VGSACSRPTLLICTSIQSGDGHHRARPRVNEILREDQRLTSWLRHCIRRREKGLDYDWQRVRAGPNRTTA